MRVPGPHNSRIPRYLHCSEAPPGPTAPRSGAQGRPQLGHMASTCGVTASPCRARHMCSQLTPPPQHSPLGQPEGPGRSRCARSHQHGGLWPAVLRPDGRCCCFSLGSPPTSCACPGCGGTQPALKPTWTLEGSIPQPRGCSRLGEPQAHTEAGLQPHALSGHFTGH